MSQLRLQLDEDMKKASADPATLYISKRGDFVDYSNSHWLTAATDDERTGTKVKKKLKYVLAPLYMCPELLYTCPHTTVHVSSYCYMCPQTCIFVS